MVHTHILVYKFHFRREIQFKSITFRFKFKFRFQFTLHLVGIRAVAGLPVYAAAKWGVIGFTISMAGSMAR